jgi:hypothetical protein
MKNITKILNLAAILLLMAGMISSCGKEEEKFKSATTGTIIGGYSNGFVSKLVQVDKKYSIGKSLEYVEVTGDCTYLPENGTYQNMIQIQGLGCDDGTKISFSYHEYDPENQDDVNLFLFGAGNMMCANPNVPIYVVTDFKIIE